VVVDLVRTSPAQGARQIPIDVRLDDRRVDVALSAHRTRIPQTRGDLFDGDRHVPFREARVLDMLEGCERSSREHRAGPGAEVLRG